MTPGELARAALRDVARRPLRNGLAVGGVLLASALVVALFTLEAGIRRSLAERALERPLLSFVQVTPASARAGETPRPLSDDVVAALGHIKGVRQAIPILVV